MAIYIKQVKTKKDYLDFIRVGFKIYKKNKFWVPPLVKYEMDNLYPRKNPAYKYCKSALFIAYKDNLPAGRIVALINEKECQKSDNIIARFSRVEFIDDREVSGQLFESAEKWAKENKATLIHGPLGFTNFDHQGLLIHGFDQIPTVASVYNHPYYEDHITALGYEKEIDWVEYKFPVPGEIPEFAQRVSKAVKNRYNISVPNFKHIEEILPYAKSIMNIIDQTYRDIYSATLMDEEMVEKYIQKYLSKLNPKFIKIALNKNNSVVGFVIGMPSLSKTMKNIKGQAFPFGVFNILETIKKPRIIDLYMGAVTPLMQGKGIPALLMAEMTRSCIGNGIKMVETNSELETNSRVQSNWKYFNAEKHKRKRCYIKEI